MSDHTALREAARAVRAQRGAAYRRVSALTLRPSQDIGAVAAECYAHQGPRSMGLLPGFEFDVLSGPLHGQ